MGTIRLIVWMFKQQCCSHFIDIAGPEVMGDSQSDWSWEPDWFLTRDVLCHWQLRLYSRWAYGSNFWWCSSHIDPAWQFQFFASQLRICIEMTFGLMVKKWGILQLPSLIHMKKIKLLILVIICPHNSCISERLKGHERHTLFQPQNVDLPPDQEALRISPTDVEAWHMNKSFYSHWCRNQGRMVTELEEFEKTRARAVGKEAIQNGRNTNYSCENI